ncbi:MAG: AAA family ATPase [Minicystis sp.]
MYLRKIRVQHLKLLRDLTLDFTDRSAKSGIRDWTVIIGQNGTAKTSLLQAIALAAAGSLQVNTLAKQTRGHLRDRRSSDPLAIDATFEFLHGERSRRLHPHLKGPLPPALRLQSSVSLADGESTLRASAHYEGAGKTQDGDPLDEARSRNRQRWFVAGYGVARFIPNAAGQAVTLDLPSIERMTPLFDARTELTSTNFSSYFGRGDKARLFHRVLKRALLNVKSLLPDIRDIELRGYGGVDKPGDLLERNRFLQQIGKDKLKVPGVALAHGYQSVIAWIADLVGHVLLEADVKFEIEPEHMEGLVLVDEIDLYLHPIWQATLIPALRKTFKKLQFIVTTHSPVVLSGVAPHEIIRLASFGDEGDVVEVIHHPETGALVPVSEVGDQGLRPDARMMTGSEILRDQFGLDRLTPNPEGEERRRHAMLASDPYRTGAEDKALKALSTALTKKGATDLPKPVRRRKKA